MNKQYEVNTETQRPFRLYNAKANKYLPHRCYAHIQRAHMGALLLTRWAQVGEVIEVIDVSIGKLHGSYRRGVNHIKFFKGGL